MANHILPHDSVTVQDNILICDVCGNPIEDPLNKGALVWELVARKDTIFNTAFRITHRLPYCIQHRIEGKRPQWRYLSDFWVNDKVDFGVLLNPKYDDFGYRIDPDAEYDRESLNAVLFRMADALETKPQNTPKHRQPRKQTARDGYVYLIQSPSGHYKIGRTSDPKDRMKTFNVKLPFEVEFICVIPSADMYLLEKQLHRQFESKRINGEWFALGSEDVAYIKGLTE